MMRSVTCSTSLTEMKRVVLGLSGGVDSAVSALLLKRRGFNVIAVFMVNWDPVEAGSGLCPSTRDEADAASIALRLNIPFYTVNFVKEYWNMVFVRMLSNYAKGRTVVPDNDCNKYIKFDHLQKVARERFNADYVATGHYASTSYGNYLEGDQRGRCRLLSGLDPLKDQSYFLASLKEHQLTRSIFPLGSMTKTAVKKLAEENGLGDIASKTESMGICHVGKQRNFDDFLREYLERRPGFIKDIGSGSILGEHDGIHLFTLGKRISLSSPHLRSHLGHFVAQLDHDTNTVYACEGSHHPRLYAREFVIDEPEWITEPPQTDKQLTFGIQRTHPPLQCTISRVTDSSPSQLLVKSSLPLRAVASGQMCVFYCGRECLGGGEVREVKAVL